MMGENYSGSYSEAVSCTEIGVRGVFAACDCVVSSSLRSSSDLTFRYELSRPPHLLKLFWVLRHDGEGVNGPP